MRTNNIIQLPSILWKLFIALTIIFIYSLSHAATETEKNYNFPLRISKNGRYFEDQKGNPFLIHGDTAWSLIVQLNLEDAEYYIRTRNSQGFNALLVNLIEHKFANKPPKNVTGDEPFKTPGDFSTPNEKYFQHADKIISMAAKKGMLILLTPAYLGYKGGDEGWYQEIIRAGPSKLRSYGKYLGNRYKHYSNIIWVMSGDYTPPWFYRWSVNALAKGIREAGATQLMTAHCWLESPVNKFGNNKWLDFTNVYSYEINLTAELLKEYNRRPIRPFIMIESIYEGEHNVTPERLRKQAYCSLLNGATGHFYGNNPIWNFNSPVKVFPTELHWKEALKSHGAVEMGCVWKLFGSLPWSNLEPDINHNYILINDEKSGSEHRSISVAKAKNDKLIIAYIESGTSTELTLDLAKIRRSFHAFWYDPARGEKIIIPASLFAKKTKVKIGFPQDIISDHRDWLLILQSKANRKL